MPNKDLIQAVRKALSAARLETFEIASAAKGDEDLAALNLYAWNARVSAALLAPLHICEIVVRNAVAEAIEHVYGHGWPWSPGFERSLPDPMREWSARREIIGARRNFRATGKVIPELKFVFWQNMLTQRHDLRLWVPFLHEVFPNIGRSAPVAHLRHAIYLDLKVLRELRNRIAHHEPILNRDLMADYQRMVRLVGRRCGITSAWMGRVCGDVPQLIEQRP